MRRAGASSSVASTFPAVTRWPTLTFTVLSWPALVNPRFCSVIAASEPDDDTAVVTLPRSTRAVGGAGGADDVVQATSVAATSASGPIARASRRNAIDPRAEQERGDAGAQDDDAPPGVVATHAERAVGRALLGPGVTGRGPLVGATGSVDGGEPLGRLLVDLARRQRLPARWTRTRVILP